MAALPLDLYIITFNCGRALLDIEALSSSLLKARKDVNVWPDVVVMSLQEVAPLAYSFIGGSFLAPYFAPFVQAVNRAAGSNQDYRHLITHNVGMTAIVVMVKSEISANIHWVQTAEVGVGWSEMGNKGAAGVRLGYKSDNMAGPLPLTFVAAHLAPMEDQWERRNEDWENIVKRLAFKSTTAHTASLSRAMPTDANPEEEPLLGEPSSEVSSKDTVEGMFIANSPIFFAGDLNYRTSDTGPYDEQSKSFPQPVSDTSDSKHYSKLLPFDQLTREKTAGRTLHALTESQINFPPTYKFSEKQQESMTRDQFLSADDHVTKWLWSSHRWPSWCDRIFYSQGLNVTGARYEALAIQPTSDHRPVALSCQIDLKAPFAGREAPKPPFALRSDAQARRWAARRKELATGVGSYLGYTYEGNGLLAATLVGIVGGWWVMSSLVAQY